MNIPTLQYKNKEFLDVLQQELFKNCSQYIAMFHIYDEILKDMT